MKIAVLGPIPRDHITTHKGEVIEKYGCITHPVIALSRLSDGENEIIPVAHIRKQDEAAIKALLSPYPGVRLDHITSDADQGDIISLQFIDQNRRQEKQLGFMDPILPEDVVDLVDADVFVFLPITDFEISLDTLQYLKANSEGIIIFDAHGPTNGVSISGTRYHRFWLERDQWLPYIDVLKMNLEEANCCWFEKEYSLDDLQNASDTETKNLRALGEHCLNLGVKAVMITLDERGCLVFSQKDGELYEEFVPSVPVKEVIDTTGCGDSFAGGIAFGLLREPNNFKLATQFGNALGAQRTQGKTFEVFKTLAETEAMIAASYGQTL